MSPTMTVCNRHHRLIPVGQQCEECVAERSTPGAARRQSNNRELGRNSQHWRRLAAHAKRLHPICADCGGRERKGDQGSKLTADLEGGGDHSRASLEQIVIRCRRCHGRRDGGVHARGAVRRSLRRGVAVCTDQGFVG